MTDENTPHDYVKEAKKRIENADDEFKKRVPRKSRVFYAMGVIALIVVVLMVAKSCG